MKILIVKTSAIGDVSHTLPALNAIRSHYPDAHITWLVEEDAADIVIGHKALDRVLVSKRKRWIRELRGPSKLSAIKAMYEFIRQIRDTQYDMVIDFQNLLKSGVLIALTRAKRKVGFGRGMEHSEYSYLFLNEHIPAVDMNHHAVSRELMLLEALGVGCKDIRFDVPILNSDRKEIEDLLAVSGTDKKKPLIAINPISKWETKLWGNQNFADLADHLIEKYNAGVIFTGSRSDLTLVQDIISRMKCNAVNLTGRTTLKMLTALYEKIDTLISTDTGPMHLAAAVGTPVVALFGPTAPWRTGPFGSGHQIIRADLVCSPCFKRQCDTTDCMKQISVQQVLNGVKRLGFI
ncbi:MAG: lipopolysaccharide heptosyltransferase II [Deltaproteobacteria bacterium]|nr:lipopolysaccharide heptosyltransferase II [Deltaproteobacteria bacterium]